MLAVLGLFFAFLVGHALADFPLQGEYLALGKNCHKPLPDFPWYIAMWNHALIHGGVVGLIAGIASGLWILGLVEVVFHFLIDFFKCDNKLSIGEDQALHYLCKAFYVFVIVIFTVYF